MTSRVKNYPFELAVSRDPPSAVLADQVKTLDWRAKSGAQVDPDILAEVQA